MSKVREKAPKSFQEFVELVEGLQVKANGPLWYRGCGKSRYELLPTLYRHEKRKKIEQLAELERQLITRFRQRSIPFHGRPLTDEWDTLFFMQHYGVPTRLLDWTENPFIGFYFAVMTAHFSRAKGSRGTEDLVFREDAAVWVFCPVEWNSHALKHQKFDRGILTPGDEALKGYRPLTEFSGMNAHPVALYGAHNSPRIVAQRGAFTIFGQDTRPMEIIHSAHGFPEHCLVKIKLSRQKLQKMRKCILRHGITESVVFPDLDGLAREIKRDFGFEG